MIQHKQKQFLLSYLNAWYLHSAVGRCRIFDTCDKWITNSGKCFNGLGWWFWYYIGSRITDDSNTDTIHGWHTENGNNLETYNLARCFGTNSISNGKIFYQFLSLKVTTDFLINRTELVLDYQVRLQYQKWSLLVHHTVIY